LLGLASLHVKRDDCTGLGLDGNKIRKLEFYLAEAMQANADLVVCGGVVQSNTARQVAAACAKLGLECTSASCMVALPRPSRATITRATCCLIVFMAR
jgi:1-aminocyclopropane-1-carboxylate deaminase/D-cysteine desulfhydrase-like pyridoxal-dependent ACC family enzyme